MNARIRVVTRNLQGLCGVCSRRLPGKPCRNRLTFCSQKCASRYTGPER